MAERHYISIYFDSEEQKKAFRSRAADAGISMAELAKRTVIEVHNLPLFLDGVSENMDKHPEPLTAVA